MYLLFDYCDTLWGDMGNATLTSELQLLENKAAKIILSLPSFYSSPEALKELCWPTLFKHVNVVLHSTMNTNGGTEN